ncbi:TPA: hypothetical protein N0F65_008333, partial [Lagenidium giganteum]
VDGAQVGVLEQADQVGLVVLRDFTHQALEWQLADQQVSRLLVLADFTQSNRARAVAMWLLDTAGGWRALAGGLGRELLAWGLATGGLAGCLLGTGHLGLLLGWGSLVRLGRCLRAGAQMRNWATAEAVGRSRQQ